MSAEQRFQMCVLTPSGRGAVAVIGLHGALAARAIERWFDYANRPVGEPVMRRIYFGRWGTATGEEVVMCRTRVDAFELHCHGGAAASEAILADLSTAGGERVEHAEWTDTNVSDPIQRAALVSLIDAPTTRTASILLDQYQGALRREIESLRDEIRSGNEESAAGRIVAMLDDSAVGLHLVRAFDVVLGGVANVGKSSLINALVGYQRSIVYHEPGTTRDAVTATTAIDGWPIVLSDTAGLRATDDAIEVTGIQRSYERLDSCDLCVLVFDATRPLSEEDRRLGDRYPDAVIVVNKCDLVAEQVEAIDRAAVCTSAVTGTGIDELCRAISGRLVPHVPEAGAAVPFTTDQVEALCRTAEALLRGDRTLADDLLAALLDGKS